MHWRLNPFDPHPPTLNLPIIQEDQTHALHLAGGLEAILRQWTKGHASAARKASREGVTIHLAENDGDWRDYYHIYQDCLRRWNNQVNSSYNWQLFEEMFRRNSPNIKLWLAKHDQAAIAGAICLYAKNHVAYWHGAALETHFSLRPVHLLMREIIHAACQSGFTWFDFNPSGGLAGVAAFKKSFGASVLSCPVIATKSPAARLLHQFSNVRKYITTLRSGRTRKTAA